jgi:hypothetical protein
MKQHGFSWGGVPAASADEQDGAKWIRQNFTPAKNGKPVSLPAQQWVAALYRSVLAEQHVLAGARGQGAQTHLAHATTEASKDDAHYTAKSAKSAAADPKLSKAAPRPKTAAPLKADATASAAPSSWQADLAVDSSVLALYQDQWRAATVVKRIKNNFQLKIDGVVAMQKLPISKLRPSVGAVATPQPKAAAELKDEKGTSANAAVHKKAKATPKKRIKKKASDSESSFDSGPDSDSDASRGSDFDGPSSGAPFRFTLPGYHANSCSAGLRESSCLAGLSRKQLECSQPRHSIACRACESAHRGAVLSACALAFRILSEYSCPQLLPCSQAQQSATAQGQGADERTRQYETRTGNEAQTRAIEKANRS